MKSKRMMRSGWYQLCYAIMLLDYVPRYGRWFRYKGSRIESRAGLTRVSREVHWAFTWHGQWGLRLLIRLGMLDAFFGECAYRQNLRERQNARQRQHRWEVLGPDALALASKNLASVKRQQRRAAWSVVIMLILLALSTTTLVLAWDSL